jgi:YcaO-like protein with predicted kinase domain
MRYNTRAVTRPARATGSAPSRGSAAGIRIHDRTYRARKRHVAGTHRTCAPRTTLARARALMAPLGITRLANLTGLDCLGVPVFSAIRPNGRSLSTSQGKGLDEDAAAASALMESIETWHAEHVALPRVRGSYRALRRSRPTVDIRRLPRAGSARPARPARPARIDLDAVHDWVEGWDIARQTAAWVPLEAVTLDCVFPRGYQPVFDVSSNGLASGNHLLEAVVHGLCEVIERDAEARWRLARGQLRLDLDTVDDPGCRRLLATLTRAGVHATVWDITSDVGVPAYGCAIMEDPREPAWRALGLYQGFGCHPDPAVALARAMCEAVQTRVTYIAGSRDDFFPFDYARATDEELLAEIWDEVTAPAAAAVDFADAPRLGRATFEDDVRMLLERLAAAGSDQVIVVDLSRPELGIPVVKVLVPGRATAVEAMG